ncbi:MAG: hypothetical protein ACYCX2_06160 [Christensenellales bacterium]
MKKKNPALNYKGITLVELIATIGVLAVVVLILVQSSVFGIRLLKTGEDISDQTLSASNDFEGDNAGYTTSAGTFSFRIGGNDIEVNGYYDTQTSDGETVLARFRAE